jgi:hypothetical protein
MELQKLLCTCSYMILIISVLFDRTRRECWYLLLSWLSPKQRNGAGKWGFRTVSPATLYTVRAKSLISFHRNNTSHSVILGLAMSALTTREAVELFQLLWKPLFLLIFTLVCPEFFQTRVRKITVFVVILRFSTAFLKPHTLYNTLPAYLLGFLTTWIVVLSGAMILCHNPTRDFWKINATLSGSHGRLVYQVERFPSSRASIHRLSWVLNLLASTRGIGWNHGTNNIFRTVTGEIFDSEHLKFGSEPYRDRARQVRSAFLRQNLWIFALDYVLVDICTYLMYHDSFLSGAESVNPFWLSSPERRKWLLILPYRLLVAGVGIYSVIDFGSRIFAILCVGVLGEELLGSWGQYWNYPPFFGSVWKIWDRGLAGMLSSISLCSLTSLASHMPWILNRLCSSTQSLSMVSFSHTQS